MSVLNRLTNGCLTNQYTQTFNYWMVSGYWHKLPRAISTDRVNYSYRRWEVDRVLPRRTLH